MLLVWRQPSMVFGLENSSYVLTWKGKKSLWHALLLLKEALGKDIWCLARDFNRVRDGSSMSKLDRILVSLDWVQQYGETK
ncbi:hypothetical protein VNO77_42293 [Canavalia gladiata]|uniref:Uncharacterized protein n=1 Tax=Canavalia gladiata TaxID=3824 RepID=A0AAN9PT98_CANGL